MTRALKLSDLPASVRAKLPSAKQKQTRAERELVKAREAMRRETFLAMLAHAKLPTPTEEHRFHDDRMWRFDYAWLDRKVALEVEGGVFSGGRHSRGAGYRKDLEKYNAATVLGWRVFRVLPEQLSTRATETMLRRVLR